MSEEIAELRQELLQEIAKVRDLFDLRRELRLARAEREEGLRKELQEVKEELAALRREMEALKAPVQVPSVWLEPVPAPNPRPSLGDGVWISPTTEPFVPPGTGTTPFTWTTSGNITLSGDTTLSSWTSDTTEGFS